MNAIKKLTLASSMMVLLSACGAGAGLPSEEDFPNVSEVINGVNDKVQEGLEELEDALEQDKGNGSDNGSGSDVIIGGGIIDSGDEGTDNNDQSSGNDNADDNGSNDNSSSNGNDESDVSDGQDQNDTSDDPSEADTTEQGNDDTSEQGNDGSDDLSDSDDVETSYPAWDASVAYNGGDRVSHQGKVYQAGWWTRGDNPASSGQWGVWQEVGDAVDTEEENNNDSDAEDSNGSETDNEASNGNETDNEAGENETGNGANPGEAMDLPELNAGMYEGYNKVFQQTSGKAIVSYFVEWGVYGRDYHVNDIPAANLTHLLYGFLAICGDNPTAGGGAQAAIASECANKQDNEVTIIDKFATLEKTYPGDTWSDDVYGDHYNGNFGQMKKLKQQYPHLKMLPSVGGWTLSTPFFAMAKDPAKRAIFVDSVVRFIKKYDFFDGVDIDWEYPGVNGADSGLASAADGAAYVALMRDLRAAFDALSVETGREYQITSAIGAGPQHIEKVNYAEAQQYMDYIFMMTYDYAGPWANITAHQTSLYPNQEVNAGYNTSAAVEQILQQGVSSEKIVIGTAMYGRGWKGVNPGNNHAPDLYPLYGAATGAGTGTWEAGVYDYKDLFENYIGTQNQGINGFGVYYDEVAEAPYLYNAGSGEFISYDSPRSVKAKAEFIEQYNLGGFLSWEIDGDNGLILNAMNEGVGNNEVE